MMLVSHMQLDSRIYFDIFRLYNALQRCLNITCSVVRVGSISSQSPLRRLMAVGTTVAKSAAEKIPIATLFHGSEVG